MSVLCAFAVAFNLLFGDSNSGQWILAIVDCLVDMVGNPAGFCGASVIGCRGFRQNGPLSLSG